MKQLYQQQIAKWIISKVSEHDIASSYCNMLLFIALHIILVKFQDVKEPKLKFYYIFAYISNQLNGNHKTRNLINL